MIEDDAITDDAAELEVAVSESADDVPVAEADAVEAVAENAGAADEAGEEVPSEEEVEVGEGEASELESGEASDEESGEEESGEEESDEEESDEEPEGLMELTGEDLEFSEDELVTDEDLEEEEEDEDASPIDEFVEEPVEEASTGEKRWYILKVQVNRENSICDALLRRVKVAGLESFFGDVLVPTEDVREFNKAGKQRVVKRKLYPGYIVVNMEIDDDSWFLVRETPGIGDFTGAVGKPAPLSEEEISRIIATTRPPEEEDEEIKTAIKFKVGDRVRVKEGYFQNHEGEVSAVDERNGRIEVMINIFGRNNPVELDHWHVEDV